MEDKPRPLRFPERRQLVHGVNPTTGGPTIVFVTVCTVVRNHVLDNPPVHAALEDIWRHEAKAWLVGRYVLMPDHLHCFVSPTDGAPDLELWVKYWKRLLTQRLRLPNRTFQLAQWDTRIRTAKQYAEKWEYVRENPVRAGLVQHPDDWPYQGEIFDLQW